MKQKKEQVMTEEEVKIRRLQHALMNMIELLYVIQTPPHIDKKSFIEAAKYAIRKAAK